MSENLIYDTPKSQGVKNVIKRARQLLDLKWTPKGEFGLTAPVRYFKPTRDGREHTGQEYIVGAPYSSARVEDKFIGLDISIDTFMTALDNPASVVYTRDLSDFDEPAFHPTIKNAFMFYGNVCSSFVNYSLGLPMHRSTHEMCIAPEFTKNEDQTAQGLMIGDALVSSRPDGTTGGHLRIVTGIGRDGDGNVRAVEISEGVQPVTKSKWYTAGEYNATVTGTAKYQSFRYKYIDSVEYAPARYELGDIYNPDLKLDFGDYSNYRTDEPVSFNIFCDAEKLVIEGTATYIEADVTSLEMTAVLGRLYRIYTAKCLKPDSYTAYCIKKNGEKSLPVSFKVVKTPDVVLTDENGCPFERVALKPVCPDGSELTADSPCLYKDGKPSDGIVDIAMTDGNKLYKTQVAVREKNGRLVIRTAAMFTDAEGNTALSFNVGDDVTLYSYKAKAGDVVRAEFSGAKCCTPSHLAWKEERAITYFQRLITPDELDEGRLESVIATHDNPYAHFMIVSKNEYGRIASAPILFTVEE